MNSGICLHPLIPCRREPSDKSEQVTQLLFGETYTVLQPDKKWMLIENHLDGYQAWIDRKQHSELQVVQEEVEKSILSSRIGYVASETTEFIPIPFGSILHDLNGNRFKINEKRYELQGESDEPSVENILKYTKLFMGAPYLWGGKSIFGIDCSGLVQVVYACAGISLPRDAYQQATYGENIDFVDLAKEGDLAFFDNEEGRITHVGIISAPGKIIHASGSVRLDTLDHQGIYRNDTQSYTHKLRMIKRVKGSQ